ncbi:BH0509 family protein [Weizmannia acidilactici]|nr:BH0509 family protein [Weizmannia acidilactici]GER73408.1 hypothetical protein BpPP18_14750 [Weizmannia acidilactici]
MNQSDREMMIEWLWLVTGYSREYWEKCSDEQLAKEYEDHMSWK